MKDFLNQDISIGDKIIYTKASRKGGSTLICPVEVADFTPCKVRLLDGYTLIFPEKIIVVNKNLENNY